MNDSDSRTHQMLVRARGFFAQCINDFSEGGAARELFTGLKADINAVEQQAAAHGTGVSQARQGTQTRREARITILADLNAICSAARVMGVENQFPRPPQNNDEQLLQLADVYASNALPLKVQFIAHELPAEFLEELAADKVEFQEAIAGQTNAVGDHISAREELDDAFDRAVQKVRKLNGLVEVRYANDPGKLAEWAAASHIERAPRKARAATPTPSPLPPAT